MRAMMKNILTSTIHAIVDAVPMVLHVPVDLLMPHSAAKNSDWDIVPLFRWACIFHMDVPEPITLLSYCCIGVVDDEARETCRREKELC
mgnify:CR=1 FL=1